MTAVIVDDLTDTPSEKNQECTGQGIANIVAGLAAVVWLRHVLTGLSDAPAFAGRRATAMPAASAKPATQG